jgi:hypothetical protein
MTILIRPIALEEYQLYLWRFPQDSGPKPAYLPVSFISYQPCPALVMVKLLQGEASVFRIPRDDLFIEAINSL